MNEKIDSANDASHQDSPPPAKRSSSQEDFFMEKAFVQARLALAEGEVPVGCVFVLDENIICEGRNATNNRLTGEAHAEIKCIDKILLKTPDIDWGQVSLYVTVEPCIMCSAALKMLGIGQVVFGCSNPRFGGMGTVLDAMEVTCPCPKPRTIGNVRADEAINLLKEFYAGTNPSAPEEKVKKKKSRQNDN
ncbi:tRNA-specific adenosine deaminase 2 [Neocloeon triangulifer]|uniref:tRNA-specific adenosine deaminase 2 n=1 Tax=Neocloeon triangulifer TaxID=2078957 RepID=UPI00286F00F8|nr:tRNA-specific adenosine deaminase 2 [Neocloeon triangulifer]